MTAGPPSPARGPEPEIRTATLDDLPAIRAILAAHGNDGPVVIADIVGPYVSHVIRRGGTRVAVVDDAIVGFGGTLDTGRSIHLADLFVQPARLGQGIGRRLLESAFAGSSVRTTFASEDPRALPLYMRAGMQPLWPCLYVQGVSTALPSTGTVVRTETASPGRLAALEKDWTGIDRTADHDYWGTMAGSDPFVVIDGDAVAGLGYARVRQAVPIRVVDRLLIHRDADPVVTTMAALARAGQGGPVFGCFLGVHPAVWPLLDAGFRIVDRDQFMTNDPDVIDPARYVPNPGML
jgi:GNAT superfamily N-acetyltransferase